MSKNALSIGLFGEFGTENLGNEATLAVCIREIQSRLPHARLRAICVHPGAVRLQHGIDAVSNHAPRLPEKRFHRIAAVANRLTGRAVDPLWRFWLIRPLDAVIVAGTGIVEDSGGIRAWWTPWTLFSVCLAARVRRVPVHFVSVGVSRPRSSAKRVLFGASLHLATARTYRDDYSRACAQAMRVSTTPDEVFPDLCFALPARSPRHDSSRGTVAKPIVGIGVMSYYGNDSDPHAREQAFTHYCAEMTTFTTAMLERGASVRMLIGESTDVAVARRIAAAAEKDMSLPPGSIPVHVPASLDELVSEIAAMGAIVATRFHNVVGALLTRTPLVAVSYAPKTDELMRAAGQARFRVSVDALSGVELAALLDQALKEPDRVTAEIDAELAGYPQQLSNLFDQLVALLRPRTDRRSRR